MSKNVIAVFLAAGLGSRFGGTKQMHGFGPNDEWILDYLLWHAVQAGIEDFVFVIRKDFAEQFEATISERHPTLRNRITYAYQQMEDVPTGTRIPKDRTKPLGTVHATWAARTAIGDNAFIVLNADDLYGRETFTLAVEHFANGRKEQLLPAYCLENTLSEKGTVNRGLLEVDDDGYLRSCIEAKKISKSASGGVSYPNGETTVTLNPKQAVSMNNWVFHPEVLKQMEDALREFFAIDDNTAEGELTIPDFADPLMRSGEMQVKVPLTSDPWSGVTHREDVPKVEAAIASLIESGYLPAQIEL